MGIASELFASHKLGSCAYPLSWLRSIRIWRALSHHSHTPSMFDLGSSLLFFLFVIGERRCAARQGRRSND